MQCMSIQLAQLVFIFEKLYTRECPSYYFSQHISSYKKVDIAVLLFFKVVLELSRMGTFTDYTRWEKLIWSHASASMPFSTQHFQKQLYYKHISYFSTSSLLFFNFYAYLFSPTISYLCEQKFDTQARKAKQSDIYDALDVFL